MGRSGCLKVGMSKGCGWMSNGCSWMSKGLVAMSKGRVWDD